MNSDIAIEVRGLVKRYKGGVLANDGLYLEVPRDIVFGLLGPNGAGKTTLVRQGRVASSHQETDTPGVAPIWPTCPFGK